MFASLVDSKESSPNSSFQFTPQREVIFTTPSSSKKFSPENRSIALIDLTSPLRYNGDASFVDSKESSPNSSFHSSNSTHNSEKCSPIETPLSPFYELPSPACSPIASSPNNIHNIAKIVFYSTDNKKCTSKSWKRKLQLDESRNEVRINLTKRFCSCSE